MNVEELKQQYAAGEGNFSIADLKGAVLEGIDLRGVVLRNIEFLFHLPSPAKPFKDRTFYIAEAFCHSPFLP